MVIVFFSVVDIPERVSDPICTGNGITLNVGDCKRRTRLKFIDYVFPSVFEQIFMILGQLVGIGLSIFNQSIQRIIYGYLTNRWIPVPPYSISDEIVHFIFYFFKFPPFLGFSQAVHTEAETIN